LSLQLPAHTSQSIIHFKMRHSIFPGIRFAILISLTAILITSCSREEPGPGPIFKYPLPDLIDPEVAGRLTESHETDSYIFYYAAGDNVEFDRCEAYARWGMEYLGLTLPKKIEFFKFRSYEEMGEALPSPAGGWAFSEYVAYATMWTWHNHECMHILAYWWANENYPPSFFMEGMAVAHEFDPYHDAWISRWNRADIREPWLDIVKQLHSDGKLYSLEDILESQSFWNNVEQEEERIAYPQAGMFTAYLIESYGLEKFKEVYSSLSYVDSLQVIRDRFISTYGIPLDTLEQDWLNVLD